MTRSRIITVILVIAVALAAVNLAQSVDQYVNLPGNNQGYEPVQPMPYSHRLHAGELALDCRYCHFGAERSRNAGVPPMNVCMNCHGYITAPSGVMREDLERRKQEGLPPQPVISDKLRPMYDALGLDETLQPDSATPPRPMRWIRVHTLPDFVYFDHRPHVNAGMRCQECHGEVQTMERVRQVEDLSMGWCVNCHRDTQDTRVDGRSLNAPIDCAGCHY